jgi:hypothetical protein
MGIGSWLGMAFWDSAAGWGRGYGIWQLAEDGVLGFSSWLEMPDGLDLAAE